MQVCGAFVERCCGARLGSSPAYSVCTELACGAGIRTGEASHPGPATAKVTGGGAAKRWTVVTVNATAWSSLFKELVDSANKFRGIDAILLQEHKLEERQFRGAMQAAARQGWKLDLTPCSTGPGGGPSGGVGVLVRRHIGLRRLTVDGDVVHIPHDERMGLWITSGGGQGGCVLAPLYLRTGEEDGEHNMRLLFLLGGALRAAGKPFIVGGDWQMPPTTLAATGWVNSIGGNIRGADRPTCIQAASAREIDFFVVHDRFASGACAVLNDVATRPHRPVRLQVQGSRATELVREICKPRAFPPDAVFGPHLPPPNWDDVLQAAGNATSKEQLDEACCRWFDKYEEELGQHFGVQGDTAYQGRAEAARARFRWVPAERRVPTDVRVKADEVHWSWLADRVREWRHLRQCYGDGPRRHAHQLAKRLRCYKPPFNLSGDERWS